ncbi:MAG: hypothetical protein H0W67_08140 [Gemmatimonadales bacterium]|nr:hypothetical protein [Gemmatimonadales bacterium]
MRLWQLVSAQRRLLPKGLEQLVFRLDRQGGRHLVASTPDAGGWPDARRLHAELVRGGEPATLWWRPAGGAARAMAGVGEAFPVTSFEQVHPAMGARVRAFAVEQLGPVGGRHVWDLYAGIGETTAALGAAGARVTSVEADRRAVHEAERCGVPASRHAELVESVVGQLDRPDLAVTNPPRIGMHAAVTTALEARGPSRLVYVSCDPATLARDLNRLPGYQLGTVRAFDLFPQTAHVETVAVLDRVA